jgi:hypothetical protein
MLAELGTLWRNGLERVWFDLLSEPRREIRCCVVRPNAVSTGTSIERLCEWGCWGCCDAILADLARLRRGARDQLGAIADAAGAGHGRQEQRAMDVSWDQVGEDVLVRCGGYVRQLRATQARLFKAVAECSPREVPWRDVLVRWAREDEKPRVNTESLQRTGQRLRKALGELGCYWQQSGSGACWMGVT